MMDTFTASNGLTVDGTTGRIIVRDRTVFPKYDLGKYTVEALREFFRAERDEELGRWRFPENPDHVVYADDDGDVWVLDERRGVVTSLIIRADVAMRNPNNPATKAAIAYFAAHPERKPQPWDNAERDEVWLFKSEGNGRALAWRAEDGWDVIDQRGNYHRGIADVPAEMIEQAFWGWENATAERISTAAEVHR